METAVISYRVADFLKKHPPFHVIADADLLALAANGRVRFHEPNEYILWQGEPHRPHVFVIQQGTVSLWDESGSEGTLRDVRGAGDMLGIERYNDARACLHSARSESDVVIYAFPGDDFEAFVLKYPHAVNYVASESAVSVDYQPAGSRREPQSVFLHDMVVHRSLTGCSTQSTIAHAARVLLSTRSEGIPVLDAGGRIQSVLTAGTLLDWVAQGGGDANAAVETLPGIAPAIVAPHASVTESILAMAAADAGALAMTADGTASGRLHAIVTPRDLASLFGEHPTTLVGQIRGAASTRELRELNLRARAFTLDYLSGAASVEWLARFTHLVDVAILSRVVALSGASQVAGCWCFFGAAGRSESLTLLAPELLLVLDDDEGGDGFGPDRYELAIAREKFYRVVDSLQECGYLARPAAAFEPSFYAATASEWKDRYRAWIADPVLQRTYRARSLFDLRAVHGRRARWGDIETAVVDAITRDFVGILANDCLASLPPLTFFEDMVVDSRGEQSATFQLETSALRPLVDVGRVFGLAARQVLGRSTIERLAIARALLPDHQATFREAADALRIVLWQQGRVGITEGTSGADLPPALLSRHDRQRLKSGFRSILRLLELTADRAWLEAL